MVFQERLCFVTKGRLLSKTVYMPIYFCMFLSNSGDEAGELFPELGELMR